MPNQNQLNTATLAGPVALPYVAIDFESAILSALETSVGVAAIVGLTIFPIRIPEAATLPALSYRIASKPRLMTLDGPVSVADATVELVARSFLYSDIKAIKDACRLLFTPTPLITPYTLNGVGIMSVSMNDEGDAVEDPVDSSEDNTYACTVQFFFRFREP